jgi:hypothetical protein
MQYTKHEQHRAHQRYRGKSTLVVRQRRHGGDERFGSNARPAEQPNNRTKDGGIYGYVLCIGGYTTNTTVGIEAIKRQKTLFWARLRLALHSLHSLIRGKRTGCGWLRPNRYFTPKGGKKCQNREWFRKQNVSVWTDRPFGSAWVAGALIALSAISLSNFPPFALLLMDTRVDYGTKCARTPALAAT